MTWEKALVVSLEKLFLATHFSGTCNQFPSFVILFKHFHSIWGSFRQVSSFLSISFFIKKTVSIVGGQVRGAAARLA